MSDVARPWPTASLGPIARARALAAALPSAAWTEGVLDAPYDTAWPWIADLEHSVPRFDADVQRVRVLERHVEGGVERMRLRAWTLGVGVPFDVRLEDGYCLMQARARLYLVIMAAEPADGGRRTRMVHLEAVPLPGGSVLRRRLRRAVADDFATLARLAAEGFGPAAGGS